MRAFDPVAMDNAREILPDERRSTARTPTTPRPAPTPWSSSPSGTSSGPSTWSGCSELLTASGGRRPAQRVRPEKMARSGFTYSSVGRAAADLPEIRTRDDGLQPTPLN